MHLSDKESIACIAVGLIAGMREKNPDWSAEQLGEAAVSEARAIYAVINSALDA